MRVLLGVLLASASVSACSGGDARISFSVPAQLDSLARSVRVRVVRPTSGDTSFDCDAVAFGEVTPERLDGATERAVVIDAAGPTELGELARNTRTLLVAEAFDGAAALGSRVAAGCVNREVIATGDEVRIDGVAAVELVGLDASLASGISVPPGDVPSPLTLVANDARGAPVGGVPVRLHVVDVGGAALVIERTSNSAGAVELATDFLADRPVGAVRLRFRAPWQRAPLSIDTSSAPTRVAGTFDSSVISAVPVPGTNVIYIAVTGDIGEASLVRVTAASALSVGAPTAVPTGFKLLVRVPSSGAAIVAGLWDDATYRVLDTTSGSFGAPVALDAGFLAGSEATFELPACGGSAPPLLLIDPNAENDALVALQVQGSGLVRALLPSFAGSDGVVLRAAGCVADDTGVLHRAVAVRTAFHEELRIEGVSQPLLLPASSSGMRLGGESDPRLLVGVQTTNGPQVRSYGLGGPPSARRLEQQGAVSVGGNPERLEAVDLDGNSALDIVTVVSSGIPPRASFAVLYQGVEVNPPLSALFGLPPLPDGVPQAAGPDGSGVATFVFDSNADGRVELWALQSYINAPVVSGPGPPGPLSASTLIHRFDFAR